MSDARSDTAVCRIMAIVGRLHPGLLAMASAMRAM